MDNHGGICRQRQQVHRRDGVDRDADGFDEGVVADDVFGEVLARGDDFLSDALGEFSGEDAGVERGIAFTIGFEQLPQHGFERVHVRLWLDGLFVFAPVGVGGDLQVAVGAGAGGDDALRRDDARDAALVVGEEFVAVGGGQAVGFVVDEDERLGFFV